MTIPKSVEEAAELAEQLHEKMFSQAPQEDQEVIDTEEPSPEETPTEEANEIPHDDDIEELRKFKAKYLTLQGKYDAEVPRLHQEIREFKQSVIEKLQDYRQPQPEVSTPPTEDKFAKFKEEYGEELYEAMKELTKLQAEEIIAQKIQPVEQHVSSVEETQIKAAQQNFISYLDTQVKGDWKKLWAGEDPNFIEFLKQPDPSGLYTYADLVQAYNDNWDADRLGKVFNSYFEKNAPTPKEERQPNPAQQAMVAPSRQNISPPVMNNARIWTQDSIKEFEAKDRAGKYSPEESQAMWDDLLLAATQGRIR